MASCTCLTDDERSIATCDVHGTGSTMARPSAAQQEAREFLEDEAWSHNATTRTRATYFLALLDALEAAETERDEYRDIRDRMQKERGRWELELNIARRERDEARAEAVRLRDAVTMQRNHWRAMLRHYPSDETVEVTTESARSAEARLTAVLEPPSG